MYTLLTQNFSHFTRADVHGAEWGLQPPLKFSVTYMCIYIYIRYVRALADFGVSPIGSFSSKASLLEQEHEPNQNCVTRQNLISYLFLPKENFFASNSSFQSFLVDCF